MPVYILDVGHGNCAIVRDADHTLVIDAGPGTSLLEFLKAEGVYKVDTILISHADKDHIGGLIGLLSSEEFEIKKIRLNTDSLKSSIIWDDLLYTLDSLQNKGEIDFGIALTVKDSNTMDFGTLKVQVLAPSGYLAGKGPGSRDRSERSITSNSVSAVIRILQDDKPILVFPGDIDKTGFINMKEYLEECTIEAHAPILIFPHHGGKVEGANLVEFTRQLCECIEPTTVVFSTGRGRFMNPQPSIVRTVKEVRPEARIVCTQLSEHCASILPGTTGEHLDEAFSAGKLNKLCCAGTIVVSLEGEPFTISPLEERHNEFIASVAPTALCKL